MRRKKETWSVWTGWAGRWSWGRFAAVVVVVVVVVAGGRVWEA